MMNLRLSGLLAFSLLAGSFACGDDSAGPSGGTEPGAPDASPDIINADPTAFRITKMTLLSPHAFFAGIPLVGTVNSGIADAIEMDGDEPTDGILDLNAVIVFLPLDQAAGTTGPMQLNFPDCTAPLATTACMVTPETTMVAATRTNMDSSCLEAAAGTANPDYDPVVPVPAPCFVSNAVDITVPLGTITLPLKSAQISATYADSPATKLTGGLLSGFVTQADADVILIPDDVLLVGGMPLSSVLEAGDKVDGPGGSGWWFYISVEAELVDYTP